MISREEASREIVRLLPAVAVSLRLAALFDLETVELTANQLLTLMLVNSAPGGRMTAGEVAGKLDISSPAATALVDRLVAAGAIERTQGADRRVVWVSVSDSGQTILARLAAGLEARIVATDAGLDQESLILLIEALRRVASFADAIGDAEPGRQAAATASGRPAATPDQAPP